MSGAFIRKPTINSTMLLYSRDTTAAAKNQHCLRDALATGQCRNDIRSGSGTGIALAKTGRKLQQAFVAPRPAQQASDK